MTSRLVVALVILNEIRGAVTVALTWPLWVHLFRSAS